MAALVGKYQINLGVTSIEITPEPVGINTMNLIPKGVITDVTPVFSQKPLTATPEEWQYRYDSITVINISLNNGHIERLELQDSTNQPTWATGTLAGLQTAIAAINAWL